MYEVEYHLKRKGADEIDVCQLFPDAERALAFAGFILKLSTPDWSYSINSIDECDENYEPLKLKDNETKK